jgi:hypothetical protein
MGSYLYDFSHDRSIGNFALAKQVKQSVGIDIPISATIANHQVYDFEQLCRKIEIVDLLDIITVCYETSNSSQKKRELIEFTNKCFTEEGLAYMMGEKGEIKYRPDQEFETNRLLTLKSLGNNEFKAVAEAFTIAFREFQTDMNKSKSALRYIFEANEILFKKVSKPEYVFDQLNAANIEKLKDHLLSKVLTHLDETARKATVKLFESYKKWTEAIHPYRHGQDVELYDNPPIDLAILALSNGASYIRWLASIAQIKLRNKKTGSDNDGLV